jgi:hypothetical protein
VTLRYTRSDVQKALALFKKAEDKPKKPASGKGKAPARKTRSKKP